MHFQTHLRELLYWRRHHCQGSYCGPQALLLGTIGGTPDIGAFPYTLYLG